MLALPLPMIVALLLGFFSLKARLSQRQPKLISALLACCAVQATIISLGQHYGLMSLRAIQPISAAALPPLIWITLQATAIRPLGIRLDAVHLLPPTLAGYGVLFAPPAIDLVVTATFLLYGMRLLHRLRLGLDGLPLMPLQHGELPTRPWRVVAYALLLSALSDLLIALAAQYEALWIKPWIISSFSALALLSLGWLAIIPGVGGGSAQSETEPVQAEKIEIAIAETASSDAEYMEKLEQLLAQQPLYLEPGLTLDRLSRRLGIPSKQLSAAINRHTHENVSRFINRHRIRHTCARLQAGDSVTEAMLASGFNTKSNFNREFRHITGHAPSEWLAHSMAGATANSEMVTAQMKFPPPTSSRSR
jgi:AraC-like DNA-binding protein